MDGFVHAMDHTTIHQEELEKVPHPQTWKFQNMSLLIATQLKSDNK